MEKSIATFGLTKIYANNTRAVHNVSFSAGNDEMVVVLGPSGAGKSTLIEKITLHLRDIEKKVGIIAIDPTSPFTGGALLGDRIRMRRLSLDMDVFVRSMGTRGNPGGIARKTKDVVKILDASGKDVILVETVGAGQSEVAIKDTAHTSIVVEVPGIGFPPFLTF